MWNVTYLKLEINKKFVTLLLRKLYLFKYSKIMFNLVTNDNDVFIILHFYPKYFNQSSTFRLLWLCKNLW